MRHALSEGKRNHPRRVTREVPGKLRKNPLFRKPHAPRHFSALRLHVDGNLQAVQPLHIPRHAFAGDPRPRMQIEVPIDPLAVAVDRRVRPDFPRRVIPGRVFNRLRRSNQRDLAKPTESRRRTRNDRRRLFPLPACRDQHAAPDEPRAWRYVHHSHTLRSRKGGPDYPPARRVCAFL
jgi:hypothetical protein